MNGRRWLLLLWLVLLLGSHGVRRLSPEPVELAVGRAKVELPALGDTAGGTTGSARSVRMAYQEFRPPDDPAAPVVVLLHGSPGSSADFGTLAPALVERFHVVAVDLPGFGASQRHVADYSIAAHADFVLETMDALGVKRFHLLGFSMGGGVAIEVVGRAPLRVRSLVLLSAIGVQELELFGNHPLNHAVHGLQLGLLWFVHEAVPHFGLLDGSMLSVEYARNFFDSDQRPLREVLSALEMPTLIVHGERDQLVPAAAAREHHRIVPHSELALHPRDHFEIFRHGDRLAVPILDFLGRVEAGMASERSGATAERLRVAASPFDPRVVPRARGLTLFILMLLLAGATLVSEDLTCISAGLLVAQGRIGFAAAVLACGLGILLGDLLLFLLGRWLGRPWLGRVPLRWLVSAERVDAASRWFRRRGAVVILSSRFLPGARLPTYVAAGVLHTPLLPFLGWFTIAVAIWTPILVGLSVLAGDAMLHVLDRLEGVGSLAVVAGLLLIWLGFSLLRSLLTWKGRRLLRGAWCRWRRWEFWPAWLFYPPVVLYVLWLGLRFRSPTLFTATNPAMPDGGFIGESKADILDGLAPGDVARYLRLRSDSSPAERLQQVREFMAAERLDLPVVLKPDVGERGRGVVVARNWREVEADLEAAMGDCMVQEYIDGAELGIFWVREPLAPRGRIISVTEKRLPTVVGDGLSTLEMLILRDERLVCMAPTFLLGQAARLEDVPAAGERVGLGDLGTHCRGALFTDGGEYLTPDLEAAVERIASSYEGFHFGRFDLRAPSLEAFRDGSDLRVLEVNGVTSEATHIYDPRYGLADAYRVLFRQWRLAFEIGAANRDRGASVTSAGQLLRQIF